MSILNVLMCGRLSRLGVRAEIVTKVGDDAYGTMITDELQRDGVDVARVIRKPGITSPFTYVIVDVAGQTRTCIHTPSEGEYSLAFLPCAAPASWLTLSPSLT